MRIRVSQLNNLNHPFELLGVVMLREENIKSMQPVIAKVRVNATKLLSHDYRSVTSPQSVCRCEVSLSPAQAMPQGRNVPAVTPTAGIIQSSGSRQFLMPPVNTSNPTFNTAELYGKSFPWARTLQQVLKAGILIPGTGHCG